MLRPAGILMTGFTNPVTYAFDEGLATQGIYQLRHAIPYSDLTSLTPPELERIVAEVDSLQFSHTFAD